MNSLFKQYEGVFEEKEEPEEKGKKAAYAYSPFALQDAIGEKNIKKIWIEYQKLVLADVKPEELVFKIVGKVKEILAIKKGASMEDLGTKNHVGYNKSKKDSNNWREKEIEDFYTVLVSIYHKSRMEKMDFETALESALLSI